MKIIFTFLLFWHLIGMEGNLSKFETDFYRLLVRCESLATEDVEKLKPWRIKAYINTLRNQFNELKKKPSSLNLRECGRRLEDLQSSFLDKENATGMEDISMPGKLIAPALTDPETTEKDMKHKATIEQEMRQRLLHTNARTSDVSPAPRHSATSGDGSEQLTKEEVERIVEQHRKIQERQIDQLVGLVRDLKESANDANLIVRQDNTTLSQTNTVAGRNMEDLSKQKKRLEDAVAKSGTLWQWLLIGLVVMAFIGMILFMKLFRKRT